MKKYTQEKKNECVKLRVEGRLSLNEIKEETGVSKSTLSVLLSDHPLTKEEKKKKISKGQTSRDHKKKDRGKKSKFANVAVDLNNTQKGKIAEAAILFRLLLRKFEVYGSVFDGDRLDWVILHPESKKISKLQVRWAESSKYGLPNISLRRGDGHSGKVRYSENEFDFIVAYDLYSDTAYVFSWDEAKKNKTTITVKRENAERWDKIK